MKRVWAVLVAVALGSAALLPLGGDRAEAAHSCDDNDESVAQAHGANVATDDLHRKVIGSPFPDRGRSGEVCPGGDTYSVVIH